MYVIGLRQGNDLSSLVNNVANKITSIFDSTTSSKPRKKSPLKVTFKADERRERSGSKSDDSAPQYSNADRLDEILEKIKDKGIKSLSKEEQEFLENQSKN